MKKIINQTLIPLFIATLLMSCNNNDSNVNWKPEDGYISNEASAIKVAEVVWLNVYGPKINDDKPFKVKLKGGIWIVEGTFNKKGVGGVPYIEIQRSDGKILKVIHGK